jgi:hypothetical protein
MKHTHFKAAGVIRTIITPLLISALIIGVVAGMAMTFYNRGRELMQTELEARLRTLVDTSTLVFDTADVESIHEAEDAKKNTSGWCS